MCRLIYFIFILGIISCSSEKKSGTVNIFGTLVEMADQTVYLEELDVRTKLLLDSAKTDPKGTFKFAVDIEEDGFYVLRTNKENYILLLLSPKEQVEINSNYIIFEDGFEISGSPGSALLKDFELFMKQQKQRVDSLGRVLYEGQGLDNFYEIKQTLDSIYLNIHEVQRKYVIDFIQQNPGSLASLIVINRKLGNNFVLDEKEDFIYFHKVDSGLLANYPNNKHALDHHDRVEEIRGENFEQFYTDKKLEPGNTAPNIVLKDTSGQFISLKDLGGKKVLVYFWAGWNAKSRQDNHKLISLYPKYKERGLEILGVSLDENEKVWKGAIKVDKLSWPNGSDLKGLISKIKKNYNLTGDLPYYYMVDEKRIILFRDRDLDKILVKIDELI